MATMHSQHDALRTRTRRATAACARPGVTLLEVILAMALTAMLLTGVYAFYSNTLRTREAARELTVDTQLARVILARIADDVRHAGGFTPGFGVGLTGTHETLTLYRYLLPEPDVFNQYDPEFEQLPPAKADLRRVEYRLTWDDELEDENGDPICHGLFRSIQTTLNQVYVQEDLDEDSRMSSRLSKEEDEEPEEVGEPREGVEGELLAPEIKYLEFLYFDGAEWVDEWVGGDSQQNALPQAIMVTIGRIPVPPEDREFELEALESIDREEREELEEEHPDRYQVVVRLQQADRFLTSRLVNASNQMKNFDESLRSDNESFRQSLRGQGLQRRGGR
ncbi:MAG: prepilin-type N-terminal cleavage/methylation domain-containing protein [Phycisphaerae bacterium]|nr:prepilin-type N-terminal cleavage/methylation domain-containing protein [Phycisphaerae bacterium]